MKPTIEELEKNYNSMRDDQILGLLEEEGMRPEAIKILKDIVKKRWLKYESTPTKHHAQKSLKKQEETPKKNKTIIRRIIEWILIIGGVILALVLYGIAGMAGDIVGKKSNQVDLSEEMTTYGLQLGQLKEKYWNSENSMKDFSQEIKNIKQEGELIKERLGAEKWQEEIAWMKISWEYATLLKRDAMISLANIQEGIPYKIINSQELTDLEEKMKKLIKNNFEKVQKQKQSEEISIQNMIEKWEINIKEIDKKWLIKSAQEAFTNSSKKDIELYNTLFN